jgi:hypothetical protein
MKYLAAIASAADAFSHNGAERPHRKRARSRKN